MRRAVVGPPPRARSLRRRSRERVLQVLFEADVGHQPLAQTLERIRPAIPEREWPFVRTLCEGTWQARHQIDRQLRPLLRRWSVDRLAGVDRAILRMAVYELSHLPTPPRVVINEAVELAKRYGTEESGRFVNGVLGALYQSRAGDATDDDA